MIWSNIIRYLEKGGEMPGDLQEWLAENPENRELFELVKLQWKMGELPPSFSPDKAKAWEKISSKLKRSPSRPLVKWSLRVAASLIAIALGFAISVIVTHTKPVTYSEIITQRGNKSCVMLPDGSEVTLNSETRIKYPSRLQGNKMTIELSGEAFFIVKHDPERKFIVNTPSISVYVHGTSFNVKSYKDEDETEIALLEGSLSLFKENKNIVTLKENQVAFLDKNDKKIYVQKKNLGVITSWRNDELIFENTPFSEVVKYLERYYGVDIELDPELGNAHNFTFKLKVESLRESLKLINQITPIEYSINGKEVTIKPTS